MFLAINNRPGARALLGAVVVLVIVFISPLCALSSALFTARTFHHLLLLLAAAPLLALSLPRLKAPRLAMATAVQAMVFWAWHAPDLYAAALSSDAVYWLMQVTILGSAVWFWGALRASNAPAAVAGLLAAMLLMGLLGALIVFAGEPLYAPHFASTLAWGMTPLEDQQAAGLIMWAPAAAAYLLVALWRVAGLFQRRETARPA
ncbi:Cytochrome c oxidase caa3 assembly factor [compost metagenome]